MLKSLLVSKLKQEQQQKHGAEETLKLQYDYFLQYFYRIIICRLLFLIAQFLTASTKR